MLTRRENDIDLVRRMAYVQGDNDDHVRIDGHVNGSLTRSRNPQGALIFLPRSLLHFDPQSADSGLYSGEDGGGFRAMHSMADGMEESISDKVGR